MNARTLIEELRGHGVELAPDGDQLRYRPKEAVTAELLDRLKAHKPQLLKLLEWERRKREEVPGVYAFHPTYLEPLCDLHGGSHQPESES